MRFILSGLFFKRIYIKLDSLINAVFLFLVLPFKSFNYKNSILVFSEPRSGSTYVSQVISDLLNNIIINWEPLHPTKGTISRNYNLGWRPKLSEIQSYPDFLNDLKRILELKSYNYWSLNCNNGFFTKEYKYVLTKFVRGNSILKFLVKNFDFNFKPILILRHPVDVCISQLFTFSHQEKIKIEKNKLQPLIRKWCEMNLPLIEDIEFHNELILVHYSDLVINPRKEFWKIFIELGLESNELRNKIRNYRLFSNPSYSDFKRRFLNDSKEQLWKNLNLLTLHEKNEIQKIFDEYNLKLFNAYSPFPQIN